MRNNSLVCYIPQLLQIKSLEGYNKRWHDKYHWFINSIVFKGLMNGDSFFNWTNLNAEILRKYIGANYLKDIQDTLINNNVIEYNSSYSPGAFSKSYRLTKEYKNQSIKGVKLIKPTYERKIKNIRTNYLKEVLNNHNIIAEFRNLSYARIDVDSALEYINENYCPKSAQYQSRFIGIEQYDAMQHTNFSKGRYDINFSFKVNKGRVYSPVTMLARDLEKFTYFIGYENEDSSVLDMPNSQLCFYNHLTKKSNFKASKDIDSQQVRDNLNNIGSNNKHEDEYAPSHKANISNYPLSPYVVENRLNSLNINTWEDLIFNSLGYEAMMFLSKWKGKTHDHTKEERQEFKAEFFGNLFYNRYKPSLTYLEQIFSDNFPNEFKLLRKSKYAYGNKLLAVKVQSLEADFFHKIIVSYMRRNYKSIPYVIKHDSIKLPISIATEIHQELNKLAQSFFARNDIKLKFESL
jgi:hypothetical protein